MFYRISKKENYSSHIITRKGVNQKSMQECTLEARDHWKETWRPQLRNKCFWVKFYGKSSFSIAKLSLKWLKYKTNTICARPSCMKQTSIQPTCPGTHVINCIYSAALVEYSMLQKLVCGWEASDDNFPQTVFLYIWCGVENGIIELCRSSAWNALLQVEVIEKSWPGQARTFDW